MQIRAFDETILREFLITASREFDWIRYQAICGRVAQPTIICESDNTSTKPARSSLAATVVIEVGNKRLEKKDLNGIAVGSTISEDFKFQIDFLHFFVLQMFWISKEKKTENKERNANKTNCREIAEMCFAFTCPSTFVSAAPACTCESKWRWWCWPQNNIILPLADLRPVDESAESRLRSEASFKNHYSDLFADPARGGNNFFKTDRRWTRKTWCVDGACWTEAARAARDGSMKCLWMELEGGSAGDCFICTIRAAVNICSLTTEAIKRIEKLLESFLS